MGVRLHIMKWFQARHSEKADQWLYAQLYPRKVFGFDLFEVCIRAAVESKLTVQLARTDLLIAVDDCQFFQTTEEYHWPHFVRRRSFLYPLLRSLNEFTSQLIAAGTEFNFRHIRDIAGWSVLKKCRFSYETISPFHVQ